ncbi:MAG: phage tail protein [Chitinophagales bacterium]
MGDPYIGEIRLFTGNYAPLGWAFCNGAQLPVQQYQALYAVIGNTYGGNSTYFNLPDLRGKAALHQGSGPNLTSRTIGQSTGVPVVSLTTNNLANHTHAANCKSTPDSATPNGTIWASTSGRTGIAVYKSTADVNMNAEIVQPVGGTSSHNNRQPCLGLNFIIAMEGIFPVRE